MAHAVRIIAFFFSLFLSSQSFAAVPYNAPNDTCGWFSVNAPGPSDAAKCKSLSITNRGNAGFKLADEVITNFPTPNSMVPMWRGFYCKPGDSFEKATLKCIPELVCGPGLEAVGTECKPKSICSPLRDKPLGLGQIEGDYGSQSASWAAGMIGKEGKTCFPGGCEVSGTTTTCVTGRGASGTTVCFLSKPKFTGNTCKEKEPGADDSKCGPGTKPSPTLPSLCIPLETKCDYGSSPSKYAEGVCIPNPTNDPGKTPDCEDPKDPTKRVPCEGKPTPCPPGFVSSQNVKGGCVPADADISGTDKDGNKTNCKDGKCTTTKPDGTTTEKPQADYCKENPDVEMCKKTDEAVFSGACESVFTCKGDVLQCAIAKEQHQRNCQFFTRETTESVLYNFTKSQGQIDVLAVESQVVDLTTHLDHSTIITGSCPADVTVMVAGKEVKFAISEFCSWFSYIGLIIMAATALTCLRILAKD